MKTNQDEFFGKWLALAHLKLFNLLTRILHKEGFDLTFEQFILLKVINADEGITQKELALTMSKDKTSVARAISVLEDRHKVVRISSKDDKRKKGLYLTKEGREHLKKVMPKFMRFKEEIGKEFDQAELTQITVTMKKIIDLTNKMEKQL